MDLGSGIKEKCRSPGIGSGLYFLGLLPASWTCDLFFGILHYFGRRVMIHQRSQYTSG